MNPGSIPNTISAAQRSWDDKVNQAGSRGFFEKLRDFISNAFGSGGQTSVAFQQTSDTFKDFFREHAGSLADKIPVAGREAFQQEAESKMNEILTAVFEPRLQAPGDENRRVISNSSAANSVLTANSLATRALSDLKTAALRAKVSPNLQAQLDSAPQFVAMDNGKVCVIRKAPQIENLVLRGGGAKGIGYGPALLEMERAGVLSGLKTVVGTSAGALTAACLAAGLNAEEFQKVADDNEMASFKQTPRNFHTKYPTVNFGSVGFNAGRALEIMDHESAKSVKNFLVANWSTEEFQKKLVLLPDDQRVRMAELREQNFEGDRTNQMITFNDLRALHVLEPTKFKELTLTGWNDTDKRSEYFQAGEPHGDMPIALAARISMSIPVFFAAVRMDQEGARKNFTDGGVGTNMPSEAVFNRPGNENHEETAARTLLMTFDENGKAYNILHGDQDRPRSNPGWFTKKFSGNANIATTQREDRRKAYDAGPNTFVTFHGDIGTLDLKATPERQLKAKQLSAYKTLEQIEARQNQAYHEVFDSLQSCISTLSEDERAKILSNPPDPAKFPEGAADKQYALLTQVHLALAGNSSEPNIA